MRVGSSMLTRPLPRSTNSDKAKGLRSMERKRNLITVALLLLSAVLIGAGIAIGEPSVVLSKAVNVCMECIGIA